MIDLHLINAALAGLTISAGAAVLIAAAVLTIAALGRHRVSTRRGQMAPASARVPTRAEAEERSGPGHARKEPALR